MSRLTSDVVQQLLDARSPKRLPATDRTRMSAVAATLRFDRGEPEVLLIRRAEHPNDHWSGHMAFPGGRQDPADATTLATALRETREEIGIDLERHGKLLGRLDDVQAISKGVARDMLIVPYVFAMETPATPQLDPTEVARAHLGLAPSDDARRGGLRSPLRSRRSPPRPPRIPGRRQHRLGAHLPHARAAVRRDSPLNRW